MNPLDKALLVIDMQSEFETAKDSETLAACADAIVDAMAAGETIIVLTCESYGKFLLSELVRDYDKLINVEKFDDDGSHEVREALSAHGYSTIKHLAVCGVNLLYCVYQTLKGLQKLYPNASFELLLEATNNQGCRGPQDKMRCVDFICDHIGHLGVDVGDKYRLTYDVPLTAELDERLISWAEYRQWELGLRSA